MLVLPMRLGGLSCQLRTDGACEKPSGARALRAVTVFPSSSASVLRLRVGFRWNISSILPFFRVSISTQSPVWYPVSDTLVGRTGSKHSMQLCLNEKRHQHVCHAVVQLREHTLPTASRSFQFAKVGSRTTASLSPGRTREQAVAQARHQQIETTP